jgi:spermidine/putrescine transport system permease protein
MTPDQITPSPVNPAPLNPAQRQARADARRNWLLSAPALLFLTAFATLPFLGVLVYSFLTPGQYGNVVWKFSTDGWVGLVLTHDVFDDTLVWADAHLTIIWRTVRLASLTTLITFVIGFPMAWFIATRPPRTRAFWLFLITIPFWTNLLIRTFAINEVIRNEGLINSVLMDLGLISSPIAMIYSDGAVLVGMGYAYLPLMVLPLFAAMDRFDMRLLEAGYDLYASRLTLLWRIVVPVIKPGIIAGCILVFIPALGAYVTPRVLGGGKNMMLGNLIDLQFGQGRNWPLGAAISITLAAVTLVAMLVILRATTRPAER